MNSIEIKYFLKVIWLFKVKIFSPRVLKSSRRYHLTWIIYDFKPYYLVCAATFFSAKKKFIT